MTDMHLPSYMHFIDSHDLFQSLHVCDFNNNIKAVFLLLKINIHKVLQQKLNFFRSSLLVNSLATEAKSRESVRVMVWRRRQLFDLDTTIEKRTEVMIYVQRFSGVAEVTGNVKSRWRNWCTVGNIFSLHSQRIDNFHFRTPLTTSCSDWRCLTSVET